MFSLWQVTQRGIDFFMRATRTPTAKIVYPDASLIPTSFRQSYMGLEGFRNAVKFLTARPLVTASCIAGAGSLAFSYTGYKGRLAQGGVSSSGINRPSASTNARDTSCTSDAAKSNGFRFRAGVSLIPHPSKEDKGGEDAYFIAANGLCVGVADGVGGWAEIGVDPGLYSRELMSFAKEAAGFTPSSPDMPQLVLEYAHKHTQARGSSTACILCLCGDRLYASNLGDSGFLIVRNGMLLFMSPQQQHEFNFPYQLGSADSMADSPSAAQKFSMAIEQGDIVVAATDGLFDNVYPDEAAALVSLAYKNGDSPAAAAGGLAQFARSRAADPTHLSPFAYGAQQLGFRYFGGKMDDITVLCAYIDSEVTDQEEMAEATDDKQQL